MLFQTIIECHVTGPRKKNHYLAEIVKCLYTLVYKCTNLILLNLINANSFDEISMCKIHLTITTGDVPRARLNINFYCVIGYIFTHTYIYS